MQSQILAALAIIIGVDTVAHANCIGSICLPDETATAQAGAELTLKRRIENALKDLEIYNAFASTTNPEERDTPLQSRIDSALRDLETTTSRNLKTDEERRDALLRRSGIQR